MSLHRITHISDAWYDDFYKIYTSSFPIYEQRDREQQIYAFSRENYHLDCFIDNDRLLSFIAYWEFDTYLYIEHFAVNNDFRGENIGTNTLRNFLEANAGKTVLLEIDPLLDEVAIRRFHFYQKLGFVENAYAHYHPAYNEKYRPHELVVLSYPQKITSAEYRQFYHDLSVYIMKKRFRLIL